MKIPTLLFLMLYSIHQLGAQQPAELGGEALRTLSQTDKGNYSSYVTEYKRMYAMFLKDNTFDDYLADGKKYTVFVPDNTAIEVYYRAENMANGNPPRLRNILKYSIAKGKFRLEDLKDGQILYTTFPSNPITVSVKKDKIYLLDRQGNRVRIGASFEAGNVIFYPVKTLLRY